MDEKERIAMRDCLVFVRADVRLIMKQLYMVVLFDGLQSRGLSQSRN